MTHGGSGFGSSVDDLREITDATVSDKTLAVMDSDVINAFPTVLEWIRGW